MPVFSLYTNVAQEKITDEHVKELSATVAKLLHKPEGVSTSTFSASRSQDNTQITLSHAQSNSHALTNARTATNKPGNHR